MTNINVKLKPKNGIKVRSSNVYVFDPDAIMEYVDLSEEWATKTDGLVDETDYSSKAYAIGGTGTETNNSKYYAEQSLDSATASASSAELSKQWAIGDPSEPTGGSAKYWAGQASSMANRDLSNLTATGEAKFDAKQDVISDLATIRSGAALGATAVQPADLATVALSGDYDDLLNKPTIPTVNDATLTITQGGVSKGIFTANASSDVTIDLDAGGSDLPSQTGHAGEFLTTDGTDAGWATVDLSSKADVDLSNINPSATAKEEITSWGLPDYNSGVSVSTPSQNNPYVASYPCLAVFNAVSDGGTDYVYVNGAALPTQYTNARVTFPWMIYLDTGDSIYCTAGIQNTWIIYPLKGTQNA